MGFAASVVVIAVGACLLLGVRGSIGGVDASAVAVIVIVLGGIGALLSLVFQSPLSRQTGPHYDDEVPDNPSAVERRDEAGSRALVAQAVEPGGRFGTAGVVYRPSPSKTM